MQKTIEAIAKLEPEKSTLSVKQFEEEQAHEKTEARCKKEHREPCHFSDVAEKNGSGKRARVHRPREGAGYFSTDCAGFIPDSDRGKAWKKKAVTAAGHDAGNHEDHLPT